MVAKVAEQMEADGTPLVCNLVFDEIAIRKNLQWCNSSKTFLGYASPLFHGGDDEPPLANNAIVYMLTGVNMSFQIPIAHHFITTIRGDQRADLLLKILRDLSNYNIRVGSITFDGYSANASMCAMLGADLEGATKTTFHNPYDGNKIHIIYDPSHMMKLARNKLSEYGAFYDDQNQKIEWDYIVKLEELSREYTIGLTHKLRTRHIKWNERPMNVRIAAETLSSSVADAMEYLMRTGHRKFKNAGPTIRFIRIFDKLFDVMNSMDMKSNEPSSFKSSLNPGNKESVFEFLMEAKAYIATLKVKTDSGVLSPIVATRNKTGFRGFLVNISSIMSLYTEYVEEKHWLEHLPVYRMSQDHLELFFGRIRSMHGCNDNPTVQQFSSSYRKLYFQNDLAISIDSNVAARCFSNILRVSSAKIGGCGRPATDNVEDRSIEQLEDTVFEAVIGAYREDHVDYTNDVGLSFVAGIIEQRVLRSGVSCESCIHALEQNEKVDDDLCLSSIQYKPCRSTFQICKLTEMVMKSRNIQINPNKPTRMKLANCVFRNIDFDKLYSRFFYADHDIVHKHCLIKTVIEEFVQIKCTHIAKAKTLEKQGHYIRHTSNKRTHFSGQ